MKWLVHMYKPVKKIYRSIRDVYKIYVSDWIYIEKKSEKKPQRKQTAVIILRQKSEK